MFKTCRLRLSLTVLKGGGPNSQQPVFVSGCTFKQAEKSAGPSSLKSLAPTTLYPHSLLQQLTSSLRTSQFPRPCPLTLFVLRPE
jgi:hypothetical protein